ncbi:hypothetical protein [Pedobacter sp. JY14-1]|uniref:hypothetical protein n=1 Tax=Pedobacter sp. JY14-1 TaxID=3034151 RepID=UPI0023E2038A|nr:hypothetical protein [Pedobacter sp. JY14-1]
MREFLITEQLEQATEVLSKLLLYNIAFGGVALNDEEQEKMLETCNEIALSLERLRNRVSQAQSAFPDTH